MIDTPVKDAGAMIAGMAPILTPGEWVFCTTDDEDLAGQAAQYALAQFAEAEGTSIILPRAMAVELGFDTSLPMAQITLTVHSALDGVGLTAAVATVLAEAGIPCNMVAAYHHDHAFVPSDQALDALEVLTQLSQEAQP